MTAKKPRVLLMMSGGVDSNVSSLILQEKGYEVVGLTLSLSWDSEGDTCCGVAATCRAKRVCDTLGIEHHTLNQRVAFQKHVIVDAYVTPHANGETPSPCVSCNAKVKIGGMWKYAQTLDCDLIATGHYAKVIDGEIHLAADQTKDQTYMLSMIPADIVGKLLFPLGDMLKSDIKAMADRLGLGVPSDSQDLCFVSASNRMEFLADHGVEMTPGNVVDSDTGKVLGTHKGIQGFTVGQTKGLGISSPSKLYVLRLNKGTNEVVVSHNPPETREFRTRKGFNWLSSPQNHANLVCKVRYRSDFVPVEIVSWFDDDTMVFRFKGNANKGNVIAPGQVIAVWEGSRLLGGGIIESAVS